MQRLDEHRVSQSRSPTRKDILSASPGIPSAAESPLAQATPCTCWPRSNDWLMGRGCKGWNISIQQGTTLTGHFSFRALCGVSWGYDRVYITAQLSLGPTPLPLLPLQGYSLINILYPKFHLVICFPTKRSATRTKCQKVKFDFPIIHSLTQQALIES